METVHNWEWYKHSNITSKKNGKNTIENRDFEAYY
jgi:hypothetical protein